MSVSKKKIAVCAFEGRKRKIVYTVNPNRSDLECLLDSLKKDECLGSKLKSASETRLTHLDPDVHDEVEITDDDVLPGVDNIAICFVYNIPNVPLLLGSGDSDVMKTSDYNFAPSVAPPGTHLKETPVSPGTSNKSMQDESPSHKDGEHDKAYKPQAMSTDNESSDDGLGTQDTPSVASPSLRGKLKYPVPLPEVKATKLKEALNSEDRAKNVLLNSKAFVTMFSSHLISLTGDAPTKKDYKAYAESVVGKYPEFADDEQGGFITFKKQLTASVRNKRYYGRKNGLKSPAKSQKAASVQKPTAKKVRFFSFLICFWISNFFNRILSPSSQPSTSVPASPGIDRQKLLTELKKIKDPTATLQHCRYLLEETLQMRRAWILEGREISDILSEYPVLKNVDLILAEYELIGYGLEKLEKNWPEFTEKVLKLYGSYAPSEGGDDGDEDAQSDAALLDVIYIMIKRLSTKFAQTCKQIITVKKVFEALDDLDSTYINAPRLVIFLEGDSIKTAYLVVAKASLEVEGDSISLVKCLAALLGSYYVFNVEYPAAYKNFLLALDLKLAGSPRPQKMPTMVSTLCQKWRCV